MNALYQVPISGLHLDRNWRRGAIDIAVGWWRAPSKRVVAVREAHFTHRVGFVAFDVADPWRFHFIQSLFLFFFSRQSCRVAEAEEEKGKQNSLAGCAVGRTLLAKRFFRDFSPGMATSCKRVFLKSVCMRARLYASTWVKSGILQDDLSSVCGAASQRRVSAPMRGT